MDCSPYGPDGLAIRKEHSISRVCHHRDLGVLSIDSFTNFSCSVTTGSSSAVAASQKRERRILIQVIEPYVQCDQNSFFT